ncbi:MAG: glycosyl hydrolase family 28 protein, partial [Rikenellaceae bacterium]|nr:glycosyl hydrolase family 28 protein [Rikenellaceae bacterium]
FAALVNADRVDGFTISGTGTIDGNGLRYWKSFWQRRRVIPKCTNMDELRPRLVYISNSKDVQISGVKLVNSPFWTTHIYKCERVKYLNVRITSPHAPVKAPSTDAIDIDACKNVLIKGCYMAVNDDAVALKGGKGPTADQDPNNGGNENIIIEDCTFGFCHGVLTCGSESIFNRNIIVRRCEIVDRAQRLLWLKMRTDTPQNYQYILVEDIKGKAGHFLFIKPWSQFFDLKGAEVPPKSYSSHVTMRNIDFECESLFSVSHSDQYELTEFTLENLNIRAENPIIHTDYIQNFTLNQVVINGKKEF